MPFSLEILEFGRLLEMVARNAQTPMGAARVSQLLPFENPRELARSLDAVAEMITLHEEKQVFWSFGELRDPSDAITIIKIKNAALDASLLLELAVVCSRALNARALIQPEKEFAPVLWSIVEVIPPALSSTLEKITRRILPGGELDDAASPELASIRREINAQRTRITRSLESLMRSSGDAIQDQIVTVRNDRFVIPVRSEHRGKIGGVAHGASSSGATIFIEPLESIEANNELQILKGKEQREVARILLELTDAVREQLPAVEAAAEAVAELDLIRAKVEFARAFNAVVPVISDNDELALTDARHPLLEENLRSSAAAGSEIVPSSFGLDRDRSVMIISGANAGGKTVVLKTAGLLSLMAISGLPVPAKAAKIPFYRSILADIGDHQSLSANLSTFSSHMSNIAEMIRECVVPSLVLLDEAGTGTDPEEGSALGVAIVDHFRRQGAQVIASTHYRGLKIYAANDPAVINASVEFDERTLQPTYKLLLGLAGASSGIDIAGRFGIADEVIANARLNLDISAQQAEAYLKKLSTETRRAEDLRIALEEEREATAMKYAGLEVEAVKREKERKKQFEQTLAEAVDAFDRQSKAFIANIEDKALKNRLEKERSARKAELNRAIIEKVQPEQPHARDPIPIGEPVDAADLAVGSQVITSFGSVGTIEKIDKANADILVGGMRLREKISGLRAVAPSSSGSPASHRPASARTVGSAPSRPIDAPDASAELNLIGKTTAEAEYELDRFIDEAYMASLPRLRIIHGFGTGALKNFVHHFLKNHDLIESFAFASDSEGGHGATIALLRS